MTKKNVVLIILLAVLAILSIGCEGMEEMTAEQMASASDKLTVEHIVEWQSEKRANGPECNIGWIRGTLDFYKRLELLHACSPTEEDTQTHAELLLDHIVDCCKVCYDAYPEEGSEGNEACKSNCRGDMDE